MNRHFSPSLKNHRTISWRLLRGAVPPTWRQTQHPISPSKAGLFIHLSITCSGGAAANSCQHTPLSSSHPISESILATTADSSTNSPPSDFLTSKRSNRFFNFKKNHLILQVQKVTPDSQLQKEPSDSSTSKKS